MQGGDKIRLFLIAGEPSGDMIGARLMQSLKKLNPDISFSGIGGSRMQAAGLQSLFPMTELSVMGLTEVLPRLPALIGRIGQTVEEIRKTKPTALITIDSPDFCFRVAKKVKAAAPEVTCIHYVAPTVWAWRPGRAKKIAAFLDCLLALFPFEPPYFEKEGLACEFVGHPLPENATAGSAENFRARHSLTAEQNILTVLPGSRLGEISRLLPVFMQTVEILRKKFPGLAVVIPTLPHLESAVRAQAGNAAIVVTTEEEKRDAFAASGAALAASGTVTLELALAGLPSILAYKVSPVTAWIGRRLIRVSHVGLVNILLGREVVPEFLQSDCQPEKMSEALSELLEDGAKAQKRDLSIAASMLSAPGGVPASEYAASVLLNCLAARSENAEAA